MAKRKRPKTLATQHISIRVAADVAQLIADITAKTGWPTRAVLEEYVRCGEAARKGETAAGRALADVLNAATAAHQTALKAHGMEKLARSTVNAARDRLRKLSGTKAPPALRQSA